MVFQIHRHSLRRWARRIRLLHVLGHPKAARARHGRHWPLRGAVWQPMRANSCNDSVLGRLQPILDGFPVPELGIYAMLPGNRQIPHRVRVLLDYLVGRLA